MIILGGLLIVYKKAAYWKIIVASLASFVVLQTLLWITGVQVQTASGFESVEDPLRALLSGSFLFAAFYMITDPVSSSQSTDVGRWIYGALFGFLTVLNLTYSTRTEGETIAILQANKFAPLNVTLLNNAKAKRKQKAVLGGKA